MGRLIDALLGAFGIIKRVRPVDLNATWEKFILKCQHARPKEFPVSFILTCSTTPTFVVGGITGATHSAFSHALTCLWGNGDKIKDGFEIIESQALVEANSLLKYRNDNIQMVAFSLSLNKDNFDRLKNNLYAQLGKPYDIAEFLSYLRGVFGIINDSKNLYVCSTLTTYGVCNVLHRWMGHYKKIRLTKKKVKPEHCVPGDIYAGCLGQFRFSMAKYRCK